MSLSDLLTNYVKPWARLYVTSIKADEAELTNVKTTVIEADRIGSAADPVGELHVTTIGTNVNPVTNIYASNALIGSLTTLFPINSQGIMITDNTLDSFLRVDPTTIALTSTIFVNPTQITYRAFAIQNQVYLTTQSLSTTVTPGLVGLIQFDIDPSLAPYELSGIINYTYNNAGSTYLLATCYKPGGGDHVTISPMGLESFTVPGDVEQIQFRIGNLFGIIPPPPP